VALCSENSGAAFRADIGPLSFFPHPSYFSTCSLRQVYGEFKSSMISEIVEKVPIRPGDKFIDLGSGAFLSPLTRVAV
jgi:hypothetical protein